MVTRYPKYKESGTTWLGAVPHTWAVERLKRGFELKKRPVLPTDGNVTAFRDGQVTLRVHRRLDGFTEADKEIGYQGIEPGDLVIHAMDAFAGAIGVSDSRGKSTPVYSVCRARAGYLPHYFALTLRHIALSGYIASLGKGVRERSTDFRWNDAQNVLVPVPPIDEQRAILRYLDSHIVKIDVLIETQERLIETLAERRLAMIAEAIGAAAIPDDKVDGEPRVERLDRVTSGVVDCLHTSADEDSDGEYIVARTSSVRDGEFRPQGTFRVNEDTYKGRIAKARPKPGEVLLTREAPSGEACLVPAGLPICLGQRMVLVRPREDKLHPQLVVWNMYMPQVKRYLDVETSGSGVQNLTMPRIRRLPLVVPPVARQKQLVTELRVSTARVEILSAKAREMITVLKERRQALISAAVTGKIDVRGLS
jgi:type I restriction enzyme S subunit